MKDLNNRKNIEKIITNLENKIEELSRNIKGSRDKIL